MGIKYICILFSGLLLYSCTKDQACPTPVGYDCRDSLIGIYHGYMDGSYLLEETDYQNNNSIDSTYSFYTDSVVSIEITKLVCNLDDIIINDQYRLQKIEEGNNYYKYYDESNDDPNPNGSNGAEFIVEFYLDNDSLVYTHRYGGNEFGTTYYGENIFHGKK